MRKTLLAMSLMYVLILTACPKGESTVRELRKKSAELSVYGGKLTAAFGDAYRAGEITQEQLRVLTVATGTAIEGLKVYRSALDEAEAIVRKGEKLPAGMLQRIDSIFSDRVVSTFFDIIVKVGALPLAQSESIKAVISAIRLTIRAIQAAVSEVRHYGRMAESV